MIFSLYYRDANSKLFDYEPIASIEFRGTVSSTGNSSGHYICDLKAEGNRSWYRTNDNDSPKLIHADEVTKCSYVTLYKRI